MNIHEYASKGNCEGVRRELARGVPVDSQDEQNYTPLACAAGSPDADEDMVRMLIAAGADVNAVVGESRSNLVGLAACSGSMGKTQLLLDAGANIRFTSPKGYTILTNVMYSLYNDERLVPIAELLLQHGVEHDCQTDYGESPLSVASRLGRFDAVKCLLDAGADPSPLRWTALLRAAAVGTCDELQGLLDGGGDLSDRDRYERTALFLAVATNDTEKARRLLSAGASIDDREWGGGTALMHCALRGNAEMLRWLITVGADIEVADESGNTALMFASQAGAANCVQLLLGTGSDPSRKNEYRQNAMTLASNEQVVRQLAGAGEDINDISSNMKRILTGLQGGMTLNVSQAEYHSGSRPRFGRTNPELMEIPFWREMVSAGISAYQAKAQFGDTDNMEPVWCFNRFGMSFTELPDDKFVQIGGEHEDFYDPNFCIYNDVVIHERSGKFRIMGYPKEVFPPTDFHSATHVNGLIYIIGGLGYQGERNFGTTPLYRLNCQTWEIERLQSFGDNPGWIYSHKAAAVEPGIIVSGGKVCNEINGDEQDVENEDRFALDLSTMKWTRI